MRMYNKLLLTMYFYMVEKNIKNTFDKANQKLKIFLNGRLILIKIIKCIRNVERLLVQDLFRRNQFGCIR